MVLKVKKLSIQPLTIPLLSIKIISNSSNNNYWHRKKLLIYWWKDFHLWKSIIHDETELRVCLNVFEIINLIINIMHNNYIIKIILLLSYFSVNTLSCSSSVRWLLHTFKMKLEIRRKCDGCNTFYKVSHEYLVILMILWESVHYKV